MFGQNTTDNHGCSRVFESRVLLWIVYTKGVLCNAPKDVTQHPLVHFNRLFFKVADSIKKWLKFEKMIFN